MRAPQSEKGMRAYPSAQVIARENGAPFAHGLLCIRLLNVTLCVTHLHPADARQRRAEARVIVRHIPAASPFMLVGDLNTLSPLDRASHEDQALVKKVLSGPNAASLARKFLDEQRAHVEYAPMQALLDGPLHDVGASSGPSVPTLINGDAMHFTQLRLDYCLVNDALLHSCGGQAGDVSGKVLRSHGVATLSDHFPLEVTFRSI